MWDPICDVMDKECETGNMDYKAEYESQCKSIKDMHDKHRCERAELLDRIAELEKAIIKMAIEGAKR